MPDLPAPYYVAAGCSAGFIVASFFLAGLHHELRHQWWMWQRSRRRGGYVR